MIIIGYKDKRYTSQVNLIGSYNVSNYLGAVGAGIAMGFKMSDVIKALSDFKTLKGRLEVIDNDLGFRIYIDFAHTPNSLENVLTELKKHTDGKLISIFGCAGERDKTKRQMMGEVSVKLANISIFTAEDPRDENVDDIIEQISKGAGKAKEIKPNEYQNNREKVFIRIPERGWSRSFAINKIAQKNDIIVICGKGHEKSMAKPK